MPEMSRARLTIAELPCYLLQKKVLAASKRTRASAIDGDFNNNGVDTSPEVSPPLHYGCNAPPFPRNAPEVVRAPSWTARQGLAADPGEVNQLVKPENAQQAGKKIELPGNPRTVKGSGSEASRARGTEDGLTVTTAKVRVNQSENGGWRHRQQPAPPDAGVLRASRGEPPRQASWSSDAKGSVHGSAARRKPKWSGGLDAQAFMGGGAYGQMLDDDEIVASPFLDHPEALRMYGSPSSRGPKSIMQALKSGSSGGSEKREKVMNGFDEPKGQGSFKASTHDARSSLQDVLLDDLPVTMPRPPDSAAPVPSRIDVVFAKQGSHNRTSSRGSRGSKSSRDLIAHGNQVSGWSLRSAASQGSGRSRHPVVPFEGGYDELRRRPDAGAMDEPWVQPSGTSLPQQPLPQHDLSEALDPEAARAHRLTARQSRERSALAEKERARSREPPPPENENGRPETNGRRRDEGRRGREECRVPDERRETSTRHIAISGYAYQADDRRGLRSSSREGRDGLRSASHGRRNGEGDRQRGGLVDEGFLDQDEENGERQRQQRRRSRERRERGRSEGRRRRSPDEREQRTHHDFSTAPRKAYHWSGGDAERTPGGTNARSDRKLSRSEGRTARHARRTQGASYAVAGADELATAPRGEGEQHGRGREHRVSRSGDRSRRGRSASAHSNRVTGDGRLEGEHLRGEGGNGGGRGGGEEGGGRREVSSNHRRGRSQGERRNGHPGRPSGIGGGGDGGVNDGAGRASRDPARPTSLSVERRAETDRRRRRASEDLTARENMKPSDRRRAGTEEATSRARAHKQQQPQRSTTDGVEPRHPEDHRRRSEGRQQMNGMVSANGSRINFDEAGDRSRGDLRQPRKQGQADAERDGGRAERGPSSRPAPSSQPKSNPPANSTTSAGDAVGNMRPAQGRTNNASRFSSDPRAKRQREESMRVRKRLVAAVAAGTPAVS